MEHIKVYFQESSIHGFSYIVNRDLHIIEKLLWIIALLISFVCCGLLIHKIGQKYQEDAMVTYTSDTAIEVNEVSFMVSIVFPTFSSFPKIPFAAVTFCPDLLTHIKGFDYNQIVTALKQRELTIDNITSIEFVNYSFRFDKNHVLSLLQVEVHASSGLGHRR
jgi:hypothetical protein